jgi:uncharacterized protein YprB with RNaseH-like and TPR domain
MSRLKDRLLSRLRKESDDMSEASEASSNHEAVEESGVSSLGAEWAAIGGALVQTEHGEFIRRMARFPMDWIHGETPLGTLIEESEALTAINADGSPASWEKLLFFDTETTGLGIGAGNVPFMLGFGYYYAGEFVVEQCLLRNPADEPAMLTYFAEVLERFTHVVSYNGRSFDWPVLKNRYVMNRLEWSDDHLHQMDFLYPSRNLWKHILPSCSLSSVESGRLGFVREHDVPGSMAPTLYFQYIHTGEPEVLEGVFVHNERDILSLAGLAAHFAGVLSGRIPYLGMESYELLRLAQWLDKVGKDQLADEAYRWLLGRSEGELLDIADGLALAMKRKGRLEDAVRLWKLSVGATEERTVGARLAPFVELAMYYEHSTKQYEDALRCTEQARGIAMRRQSITRRGTKERELMAQLDKRKKRLLEKLQRISRDVDHQKLYAGELFE